MKRIFPLTAIILLALILVTDIGLIVKYLKNPNVYALVENVSFIHHVIFNSWGIGFAYTKGVISFFLIALWVWEFIFPSKINVIRHITIMYSLIWTLIGVLVITGVVGLLQFSAGTPIKLYDFSPLIVSMGLTKAYLFSLIVFFIPLVLLLIPRMHNRYNHC